MFKRNTNNSRFSVKGSLQQGKSASAFEAREASRAWNKQQTESQASDSESGMSGFALKRIERHFSTLSQSELIPTFLTLLQESSSLRQRELVDIVARYILPGAAWLALLKAQENRRCRLVAYHCLRQWKPQQVTEALLEGVESALTQQNYYQLHWLTQITLRVAKERPDVILRPMERLLWEKKKAKGWRKVKSLLLAGEIEFFHRELSQAIAPADTPLAAMAPLTDTSLPLPADSESSTADSLPLPSEQGTSPAPPGFWQRLFGRFRR